MRAAWLSGLTPYRRRHECFFDDNQNKDEFYPPLAAAAEVFPLEAPKVKPFAVDTVRLEGGLTFLKGRVTSADLSYVDNVVAKVHGGLRLSKCAVVLVNTLRREIQDGQLSFRGKRVLELGCGNGLPGIFACLKGASVVHFQDLSVEILQNVTIPNVIANLEHAQSQMTAKSSSQQLKPELHYYAGDWRNMDSILSLVRSDKINAACNNEFEDLQTSDSEAVGGIQKLDCDANIETSSHCLSKSKRLLMGSRACERGNMSGSLEGGYDIILMSGTVNATVHLPALYNLIMKCLRPVYGVVYLAGKKHYYGFGGGGTRQFKSMVEDDGFLGAHLVVDFTDTSFNTKEVWKFFYH